MKTQTHLYGEVRIGETSVYVEASAYELGEWATRPGHVWPCSALARCDKVSASFDESGLYDIDHPGLDDLPGDEFSAWASDVLGDTLPSDHPCWFVCVGQFREPSHCGSDDIDPEGFCNFCGADAGETSC